jgi:hypothetical protein
MPSGKRKREDFAPKYNNGGFIPQQDGAGDSASEVSQVELNVNSYLFMIYVNFNSLSYYGLPPSKQNFDFVFILYLFYSLMFYFLIL